MHRLRRLEILFLLGAVLFVVAVVGIRLFFLWRDHDQAMESARETVADVASVLEQYAVRTLEVGDIATRMVNLHIGNEGGILAIADRYRAHRFLDEVAEKLPANGIVWIVDRFGRLVAASDRYPGIEVEVTGYPWWQAHALGGEQTYVGQAAPMPADGEIRFTFSRKVPDERGEFHGVIVLFFEPDLVQGRFFSDELAGNAITGMYLRNGHIVARSPLREDQVDRELSRAPLFSAIGRSVGTYRSESAVDGVDRLVSFRRLDEWPVVVAAGVPVRDVLSRWRSEAWLSTVPLSVALLAFAALTWVAVRSSRRERMKYAALQNTKHELEQALADRQILFQEVHHRVKNNLQVTSSLLQMQAARFEDTAVRSAFRETQDRLRSIGLIHETLYQANKASNVELSSYLQRLVEGLSATYGAADRGIDVQTDFAPVTVKLDEAVPLALLVNEVLTNAFKHAFPAGRPGTVKVSARRAGGNLHVTVRDDGPGMPESTKRNSLGLGLIDALVQQLDGRYRFETRDGTMFHLEIPGRQ